MYYPCSKNEGADRLRGYREADLRLCFRICRLLVFSCGGSYREFFPKQKLKILWKKIDFDILNNFAQNIDCGYKLEPPQPTVPTIYVLDLK